MPAIARDDEATTTRERPVTIHDGNDEEVHGGRAPASGPTHGRAYLGNWGQFVYRPDAGFVGTNSSTYEVRGLAGDPDEAVVTVTVEPPPNPPIAGSDGDDVRKGTSGDDLILGGGGDDRLAGGRGSDVLIGGPGDDHLSGDGGYDALIGGPGSDTYIGNYDTPLIVLDGASGIDVIEAALPGRGHRILLDLPELQLTDGSLDGGRVELEIVGSDLTLLVDLAGDGSLRQIAEVEGAAGALPEQLLVNALAGFGQTSRTITVTTRRDVVDGFDGLVSLREAMALAELTPAADTITFAADLVTPGGATISLADELVITQAGGGLTIDGDLDDDGRPDVVLMGAGGHRILRIENAGPVGALEVTLDGLTITGGVAEGAGGGIAAYGASLELVDTIVRGNRVAGPGDWHFGTPGFGGGVYLSGGAFSLQRSEVSGNVVDGHEIAAGGGVFAKDASVSISASAILANSSIDVVGGSESGPWGVSSGGGLSAHSSNVEISDTLISGNLAHSYGRGGGLEVVSGALKLTGSTVSHNGGRSIDGGGIGLSYAEALMVDSRITGNAGSYGGGIFGGKLTIIGSLIDGNRAPLSGYFHHNARGGGISAGELILINSAVTGNRAEGGFSPGHGGGISAGTATIVNSTAVFNSAGGVHSW